MKRYPDLESAARGAAPPTRRVVCVGVFDGVHRGHQKLLHDLKAWATEIRAEPAVVTFRRHPRSVLGGRAARPVFSLEHRLHLLEREGVAAALVLAFDHEMAAWSPEEFVSRAIRRALRGTGLLLGFDGAVGRGRQGTFEYLRERRRELGIEVRQSGVETVEGRRVSTTLVREAVVGGDLPLLRRLLGRPYSLLGRVVEGDGLGRKLGIPTANLDIGERALPPLGVYFASARIIGTDGPKRPGAGPYRAVLNIGRRPTVTGDGPPREDEAFDPERHRVETHLLDYTGDLYGSLLEVEFLQWRRPEQRFESLDALVRQIRADVADRRRGPLAPG